VIVEPPFPMEVGEVDVRWPGGRCFEDASGLLPAEAPKRPDIVGCAVGFGTAGMGIGSVLGTFFGEECHWAALHTPLTADERTALEKLNQLFIYASLYPSLLMGLLFGAITGIVYAVYKCRWLAALENCPPSTPDQPRK